MPPDADPAAPTPAEQAAPAPEAGPAGSTSWRRFLPRRRSAAPGAADGAGEPVDEATGVIPAPPRQERAGALHRRRRALIAQRQEAVYHLGGLAFELYRRDLLAEDVMRRRARRGRDARRHGARHRHPARRDGPRPPRAPREPSPDDLAAGSCLRCRTPFRAEARFCWQCGAQVVPEPRGDEQLTAAIHAAAVSEEPTGGGRGRRRRARGRRRATGRRRAAGPRRGRRPARSAARPLDADQTYCLECGSPTPLAPAAPPRPARHGGDPAAAMAVLGLGAGALAYAVSSDDGCGGGATHHGHDPRRNAPRVPRDGSHAAPTTGGAPAGHARSPARPRPSSTVLDRPASTRSPARRPRPRPPTIDAGHHRAPAPPRRARPPSNSGNSDWPAGKTGWTAILSSVRSESDARAAKATGLVVGPARRRALLVGLPAAAPRLLGGLLGRRTTPSRRRPPRPRGCARRRRAPTPDGS